MRSHEGGDLKDCFQHAVSRCMHAFSAADVQQSMKRVVCGHKCARTVCLTICTSFFLNRERSLSSPLEDDVCVMNVYVAAHLGAAGVFLNISGVFLNMCMAYL